MCGYTGVINSGVASILCGRSSLSLVSYDREEQTVVEFWSGQQNRPASYWGGGKGIA